MKNLGHEIFVPTALLTVVVVAARAFLGWSSMREVRELEREIDAVREVIALVLALNDAANDEERWISSLTPPGRLARGAHRGGGRARRAAVEGDRGPPPRAARGRSRRPPARSRPGSSWPSRSGSCSRAPSFQLRRRRVDLNELVRRTLDDHRTTFDHAGVEVHLDLAPDPVAVDGDPHRIAQVIGNLLQNAVKFTPPGGRKTCRGPPRRGSSGTSPSPRAPEMIDDVDDVLGETAPLEEQTNADRLSGLRSAVRARHVPRRAPRRAAPAPGLRRGRAPRRSASRSPGSPSPPSPRPSSGRPRASARGSAG